MTNPVVLPDYFVSPMPSVWAFDESGEAIEWKDHQCTAMMLPQVQVLCRALAGQLNGLPPLTAILFSVDALGRGWTAELSDERVSRLVQTAGKAGIQDAMCKQISAWLCSLQMVDDEFRHGVPAHEAFLCEIFEGIPREWLTSQRETEMTLQWLETMVGDRSSLIQTRLIGEAHAASRSLTVLDFLSMHVIDSDSLRRRMRTGLNQLPEPESLEPVERFPLAALVKQLASLNDDLGGLARMAQSVSATLSLPRLPSDPDVLPIGGVSDVTNRGQPDRLLMSEMALDSDLLIARIANGQALYLRREQPPQPEPKHRCLLVESGVRTWGTMRLYSAAFALGSCIAQERRGGEKVDVVTVAGDNAWLEDFSSREGIERFFERLLADVHPAEALMDLAEHKLLDLDLDTQPILILSEATDRDAEFRRLMLDFPKPHLLARVEQTGWVELLQRSALGDTSLQRMRLSESARPAELKTVSREGLPLFLQQKPALRYSVHPNGLRVQAYDDGHQNGCWVLTHDRRAILLDDRKLGGIEAGSLPSGRVLASHVPDRSVWQLVIESTPHGTRVPVHLLATVHADRVVTIAEIKRGDELASEVTYCFERGQLLRIGQNITFLDTRTGGVLAASACHLTHLGSDIFARGQDIFCASREGSFVHWRKLGKVSAQPGCAARLEGGLPVIYAFDLSWMTMFDGNVPTCHRTTMQFYPTHLHTVMRINSDATEMLVCLKGVSSSTNRAMGMNAENLFRLSLHEPRVTYVGKSTPAVMNTFEISKHKYSYQTYSVRTHIQSLSFEGNVLRLHTNRKCVSIRPHDVSGVCGLTCQPNHRSTDERKQYYFEKPIPRVGGIYSRWKLRPVKLPRGEGWLDSRGLLHLRASDGSELSLTLSQGLVAGWHSSGAVFGPQYFTAAKPGYTNAPVEVVEWLSKFAEQNADR